MTFIKKRIIFFPVLSDDLIEDANVNTFLLEGIISTNNSVIGFLF